MQAVQKNEMELTDLEVKAVFITGCSGFLGVFLLEQLLHTLPKARMLALVRGESPEHAQERLVKHMVCSTSICINSLEWKPTERL